LQPGPALKEKYSANFVTFLNKVDKVETHRLKNRGGPITRTAQGKTFGKERAQAIAAYLLKDDSFNFKENKLCEPDYGFQLVLWAGTEQVEINVCFQCSQIGILFKQDEKTKHDFLFDLQSSRVLVVLAKEALPDDAVIQKLK
jgi:hypothetical protein